ncbi:MAG: flagellar hook-associated protein FlgK [Pseudomonadota bacterium]
MGLSNVLGTALSGLQVTQSSIEIVSQNIANSTTKGYTRKLHDQDYVDADGSNYVRSLEATRALDVMLQRSVRAETAKMAELDARNGLQAQLGLLFGQPGSNIALDTMYNDVVEALDGLVTTPESNGARQEVLAQAQGFAARLNQLSDGVQDLRRQAEVGIAEGVREANDALQEIERLDAQIVMETGLGRVDADLLDQRDIAIDRLNEFMEVRTFEKQNGGVSVMTTGGVMLHDIRAVEISFDSRRSVSAQQLYDRDDAQRGVGTITLGMPDGAKLDLLSFDGLRGGKLAGLVDMRDNDLVAAQTQLDEMAHAVAKASARSDIANTGTVAAPAYDLTGMGDGDEVSVTFNDGTTTRTLTLVNAAVAVDPTYTPDPNDLVVGIDFATATTASINAAIDAAVTGDGGAAGAIAVTWTAPGLTIGGTATISESSAYVTETDASATTGLGVPLFTSGDTPYTNAPGIGFAQKLGFAGSITVNQDLIEDPSRLVRYSATTYQGDTARPEALLNAFDGATRTFAAAGGVGGQDTPFKGTPSDYLRAVISSQGARTANEARRADAQTLVTQSLVERSERASGVDIEQEMADLLDLQNIYNANSQVIRVVQELMDQLMNSVR